MNFTQALKVAYESLKINKIRSALTIIGIIIGVASVITLVALTQGADIMIQNQLISLGGKSLYINPGKWGVGIQKDAIKLTNQDVKSIQQIPVVEYAIPILNIESQVVWNNRSWVTSIVGTSPGFVHFNDWYPVSGVFFNKEDVLNLENVCVLGKTIVDNLFKDKEDPIGKVIRIGKNPFRVIGVMSTLGQTTSGRDQDDIVIIPYSTFQKQIIMATGVNKIFVLVKSPNDLQSAESQIRTLLIQTHNIDKEREDTFYIKSQVGIVEQIFSVSSIMGILLGSVAFISLIVGGIGIMNIMLVSVRERTREIGIRMAVGAKEKDILVQFLVESVFLSLIGGLLGIALGVIGSKIATYLTGWPNIISVEAVVLAFGSAAIIGIFFGVYPARKASKLEPVEALRSE
jgi:putative ABC transport system permease protein